MTVTSGLRVNFSCELRPWPGYLNVDNMNNLIKEITVDMMCIKPPTSLVSSNGRAADESKAAMESMS